MEPSEEKITRAEVQDKIRELVVKIKDREIIDNEIEKWLIEKEALTIDMKQILNDLTSYQEYLDLGK